jgi:oligoribonuclease NrnB/cAMP/cGMP phosphodiesterase (DHH superfamily)
MKNILIIYHLEDNDGVCSCAILSDYIRKNFPTCKINYLPATYRILNDIYANGTEYMDEYFAPYDACAMLDVSFNEYKGMKYLKQRFGSNFTWCDHHSPIIKLSFKYKFDDVAGVRDKNRSTILNLYKHLYDPFDEKYMTNEVPLLLKYLSAFDSWTHEANNLDFETCRYINTYVTHISKLDVSWWLDSFTLDKVLYTDNNEFLPDFINAGKEYCDNIDKRNEEMINYAGDMGWTVGPDNRPACMIVIYGGSNSLMFKSVKDKCKNGIALKKTNGSQWTLSLYNTSDDNTFHCGEYLQKVYKGGGHEGAAGATISQSQFIKILKNKHI